MEGQCKKRIKAIKQELRKRKAQAQQAKQIQDTFNQAEDLYRQGKLTQAKELYQRAYRLSNDPSMREYIKRSKKEIAQQKKEEKKK